MRFTNPWREDMRSVMGRIMSIDYCRIALDKRLLSMNVNTMQIALSIMDP